MELTLDVLCSGRGFGHSALLTLHKKRPTGSTATPGATDKENDVYSRVLINAGDGTQRVCIENRIKLHKLGVILLTSLAPHNVSGLPGLILALSTIGVGKVTIIGPHGTQAFIKSTDSFVNRKFPQLHINEVSVESCCYKDIDSKICVHVTPLCLRGGGTSVGVAALFRLQGGVKEADAGPSVSVLGMATNFQLNHSLSDLVAHFKKISCTVMCRLFVPVSVHCLPLSAALADEIRQLSREVSSVLHILFTNTYFDIAEKANCASELRKAEENLLFCSQLCGKYFRAPRGSQQWLAQLQSEDGSSPLSNTGVESTQVKAPSAGALIAVSRLMCSQYVSSTGHKRKYENVDKGTSDASTAATCASADLVNFNIAQRVLTRLSSIYQQQQSPQKQTTCVTSTGNGNKEAAWALKRRLGGVDVHGNSGAPGPPPHPLPFLSSSSEVEMYVTEKVLEQANVTTPDNDLKDDIRVTFLGTGSAAPSRHRSGSAVLLDVPRPDQSSIGILLDCAEGTCNQLYAACGHETKMYASALRSIKLVWISHNHGDHTCGFPQLLEQLYQEQHYRRMYNRHNKKDKERSSKEEESSDDEDDDDSEERSSPLLTVVAPTPVLNYYKFCATVAGLEDMVGRWVDSSRTKLTGNFLPPRHANLLTNPSQVQQDLRADTSNVVMRLVSVPVQHCPQAYGCVLDLHNGKRIVYSGDCRPSRLLVQTGTRADLLIHEATFNDDRSEDAVQKRHCTVSEALSIASQMQASACVLTHFSQRYPSLHLLSEPVHNSPGNETSLPTIGDVEKPVQAAAALDLMTFYLSQAAELSNVTRALASLQLAAANETSV